jgi:ferritin
MLSNTLLAEMNDQIKHELYSAYLYLGMASHFEEANLEGFGHWMKVQAGEEQEHAMKFFEHIHDRGGKVTLKAIDQPPAEFGSPSVVFEQVLEHEKKVTSLIHHLYDTAVKDADYASQSFLKWFVDEQVEEEKNATQILEWLKMAGEGGNALFMINKQLGGRGGD